MKEKRKVKKVRTNTFSGAIGYIFLLIGALVLYTSTLYPSSVIALIGLGLTFWGALFLFVKPEKYLKAKILLYTTLSSLTFIDQILSNLDYRGKAIYLSPEYSMSPKSGTVFISSNSNSVIPPIEEVAGGRTFLKNPKGICLTPPGLGLVNLYEKESGKIFTKVDLKYLQKNLPKLLVENLELAKKVDIKVEGDIIHVTITGSIYTDLFKKTKFSRICDSIGCPICSSIAIALTRATGKHIVIEKTGVYNDGKTFESYYRTMETTKKQTEIDFEEVFVSFKFIRGCGLILMVLGSSILAWISGLTWHDMITWNKDLATILFDSRVGESVSLGIGMTLIHYLLIGSILLFLGVFMFLRKRRHKKIVYGVRKK
ncbi:hypothetical protein D4R86_03190 [bacterium]|nr:MAG: hypothetical protein D4R86_03190 [bacterium]